MRDVRFTRDHCSYCGCKLCGEEHDLCPFNCKKPQSKSRLWHRGVSVRRKSETEIRYLLIGEQYHDWIWVCKNGEINPEIGLAKDFELVPLEELEGLDDKK